MENGCSEERRMIANVQIARIRGKKNESFATLCKM